MYVVSYCRYNMFLPDKLLCFNMEVMHESCYYIGCSPG